MIAKRIHDIQSTLPESTRLIAVSKFHSVSEIQEAYAAGQRLFGENKAQELVQKQGVLPSDIKWHFIGHLQANKVKYIAPFVAMIHSVDSLKLLKEINKQAIKNKRTIDCLLELHVAQEESKFGLSFLECKELLGSLELQTLENIRIKGIMGMATFTENKEQIRTEFDQLQRFFLELKRCKFDSKQIEIEELSMGMSSDYPLAIEKGSTFVRIGTTIFGQRNY